MPPEIERRATDPILLLVTQMHDDVKTLKRDLVEHMHNETKELAEEITKAMARAYPAGDPDGHRLYHEAQMREAEENAEAAKQRKEFWQKLAFEVAKYGLLGFIGWAVVSLWNSFLQGPR